MLHRWIGIVTCLACVIWCLSGIALIYIVQPKVMKAEYLQGLNPIIWADVHVMPQTALEASGLASFPSRMRLEMSGGRPVYFLTDWDGAVTAVSAFDGTRITSIDRDGALAIARDFAHSDRPTYMALLDSDRWVFKTTLEGRNLDKARPFHLIALHDAVDRQIYLSARTGAVVMDTSAHDRFWSWLARVPHTIDLPIIRAHPDAWRWLILSSTAMAAVVLVSGMWLGLSRLRLAKRYRDGRISPFRGVMLWHHMFGIIGGITLFTWVSTAWIFMRPAQLLAASTIPTAAMQAYAGHAGAHFPAQVDELATLAPSDALFAGFTWLGGRPVLYFGLRDGRIMTYDSGTQAGAAKAISEAHLLAAARALFPGARIRHAELRTEADRYWHSFKGNVRELPVFRVKFDDPQDTWVHLDPQTGHLLQTMNRTDRTYFLFFNEIHKFDLHGFKEPVRQIVMWVLMLAGTGISITAVAIGWRRLLRRRRPSRRRASERPGHGRPLGNRI